MYFFQNAERQKRKDEAAAGTPWEIRHFEHIESDPDCESSIRPNAVFLTIRPQSKS